MQGVAHVDVLWGIPSLHEAATTYSNGHHERGTFMVQRQKPPEETALADRGVTASTQGKGNLAVESDPQAETARRTQDRFLQRYLSEFKLAIGKNGSLYNTAAKEPVRLLVGQVAVDQVEFVRDLPRRSVEAASSTIFDRILTTTFTNLSGKTETLRISYDDMEAKSPEWLRDLSVLPAPHKRRRDD